MKKKKKWGSNRKKRFCSEMWKNAVGLSICDGPMETVFSKRWVPLER